MSNTKIRDIRVREITDSHGKPTIEVVVQTDTGQGSFAVPSGTSTGESEAHEMRDPDGRMSRVIEKIEKTIKPELMDMNTKDIQKIDSLLIEMDGTENKSNLGANALLGISVASLKAYAKSTEQSVVESLQEVFDIKTSNNKYPRLFINLINGGAHTDTETKPAFQEYHLIPRLDPQKSYELSIKVFEKLLEKNPKALRGYEGGLILETGDVEKPLEEIRDCAEELGVLEKIDLGLDVAASYFYKNGDYHVNGGKLNTKQMHMLYDEIIAKYELLSTEDPFDEKDFTNFHKLKDEHADLLIVGDDLTTTNTSLIKKAIEKDSVNAVIIKINQIGTLTETIEAVNLAHGNSIKTIVSHRSGETMDSFIADLTVAIGAYGLKAGAPLAPERKAKYDRLIKIINE